MRFTPPARVGEAERGWRLRPARSRATIRGRRAPACMIAIGVGVVVAFLVPAPLRRGAARGGRLGRGGARHGRARLGVIFGGADAEADAPPRRRRRPRPPRRLGDRDPGERLQPVRDRRRAPQRAHLPDRVAPDLRRLCLAAVVTAWTLTHTAYTLRYAHLYYRDDGDGEGGLSFPGERAPAYIDFAYFAFTSGCASRPPTSHHQPTDPPRRAGARGPVVRLQHDDPRDRRQPRRRLHRLAAIIAAGAVDYSTMISQGKLKSIVLRVGIAPGVAGGAGQLKLVVALHPCSSRSSCSSGTAVALDLDRAPESAALRSTLIDRRRSSLRSNVQLLTPASAVDSCVTSMV